MSKKINIFALTVLIIFQTILMPLGTFGVTFANGNDSDSETTGSSVTSSPIDLSFDYLKYDGKEITEENASTISPKAGDAVSVHYSFALKEDETMDIGDTFEFTLPKQILIFDKSRLQGEIKSGNDTYFTYSTDDNRKVTVTVVQPLPYGITGKINFSAVFGDFGDNKELSQELVIQLTDNHVVKIPLKFEPKVKGQNVSKAGVLKTSGANKSIEWTAWFNLNKATLSNFTFTDTIGADHALPQNAVIKVHEASVKADLEGVAIEDGSLKEVTNDMNITINGNVITVQPKKATSTEKAYMVTYSTTIDTSKADEELETYSNSFTVTSDGVSDSKAWTVKKDVSVEYGTPLSKERTGGDKYRADWFIQFNHIGKSIPASTTITDTLTGGLHKYDYSTFVVTKRPIVNGVVTSPGEPMTLDTDYQFTTKGDNQFVIELLDVDEAYAVDIQYSTIATKEFIYEAGAINNKVETSLKDNKDMPYTISTNWSLPTGVGYKNLSDVDYSKKLLEWTVVVDTEGLDMKKLVIEDSFTKGLDLVPYDSQGTLYKLESAPAGVTVKSFEAKEGTDEETGLQTGFKLEFDEPTGGFKGKVVFKYQTRYDALDNYITHQNGYKNEVNFSWDGVTSVGNNLTKKVSFTPEEVQKTSVDKTGTYNYAKREFNWTAVFNANRNTIQKAQITDTLSAGQKYKGSVEIYKVTVDKNGQLSADQDPISPDLYDVSLEGATSFTVTFKNPITDAYEIRYKSEDADDIIGHTGEKGGEYTNTIAVTDARSNISLGSKTATVKVNDANVLVNKNGQQIPASSTINWSVEVNPSQSNLTNVILEDKPAVPQNSKALHWLISDEQANYPITITEITFDENGRKEGTTIAAREAKAAGWLKNDPVISKEGFKFEFVDLTGADGKPRAFIVNYSTYYDGPHQGEYTNSAKLSYKANNQEDFKEDGVDKSEAKYNHNDSDAYANFNRTNLIITKIGKDNDKDEASDKLAGAKFELWNKNGKIKFGEATTNADGIATFQNIGYGVYILKEIKGPEGYVVTKNEQVIRVTSGDNSITPPVSATLEVQNDEILQSVELTKKFTGMDANKSKAGVKFELYNALDNQKVIVPVWAVQDGEKKKTGITVGPEFITDENGKIYIADLPEGTYYFKEVETLPGYALPTHPDLPTFTIENGKTTSEKISMSNEPLKQTITNVKGDPEDNTQGTTPIKDSTFKVYKVTDSCPADGSTFVPANHEDVTKFLHSSGVLTTDSNGQIVIDYSKLGAGKFIIVQDRVNKYYENRQNIVVDCVEITTTNTEVTPTTFENERTSTVDPLTLVKVDTDAANPKPVKDATIKLEGRTVANGGAGKTYFGKTNAQGEITAWYEGISYPTTPDLSKAVNPVPDQYTVSEPAMPVGYMALAQKSGAEGFVRNLVFDYNNVDLKTVINVTNTKIIRDIVIKNTCGQDETTYKLINSSGTVMTTDVLGNPITVKAFDKTGKEIQGATIDGDGVITMPTGAATVKIINLHIAKDLYKVQQVTSSSGCQLVDEPESFPVNDSPTGTITFDETDQPITVTVTNKDKDSNDKIAGSTFKLYKADVAANCPGDNDEVNLTGYKEVTKYSDGTNITLTTNAQGQFKIDFSKLGKGSYMIVQDQVNTYYENRSGEAVNFGASNCIVIEPNKEKQPDQPIFTNDRTSTTADVILVKKDADDATRALAGAVIKLKGTKFTNRETYYGKTGTDGRITTWYASEEDAKAGKATGGIQKLEPNDYKVTEIVYPEGYTTLAGETTFIYKNDSTDTQIDITNKKIMSTFVIKNACGLEESKYQILDANGQVVKVDLSGKDIGVDGVITMSAGGKTVSAGAFHLPKGEYSIKQLTASGGCLLEDNAQKVTTPDGENPTLTFEEKDPPNKIIVTNNEEGSTTPIVGSTFDVYKVTSCPDLKDSGTVAITKEMEHKGTFTTNNKGQFEVDFSQFGSGTYIIVQNEVAKYYINQNGVPVEVALTEGSAKVICIPVGNIDEDSPEEPTFENTRQTTELKLSKYSIGTNKPVVGAEIQIKGSIKGNIYKSTTDEKGEINFGIVVEDLYIVTEVTTPKGFKSNTLGVKEGAVTTKKENGKVTFDFFGTNTATDKALIQVTNERLLSTVEILNSCGQEESTYEIHRKTESGYVKVTTDVEGKVIGENGVIKMAAKAGKVTLTLHLPDGEYKVVQTSASGGCIFEDQNPPSENQPDFKIETEEDKTYPIDETDPPNKQVVTNEEEGTTTKVPGSTFELHRVTACGANGTVDVPSLTSSTLVDSFTTDTSGTITIDYSQYGSGTYVFVQKTVGNEYLLLNEEPVSLGGSSDCLPIGPNDKQVPPTSFENERGKGTLTLAKKDAANFNKLLEGAEFEIVGKQTNEKRIGTTNAEGKLVLTDLPYDEYTITETKAPGFYTGSVVVTQSFKATTLQVDITNTIVTNPPLTNDVEGATFTFKVCNDPQTAAGTYQGTNFDYVIDAKGNVSVVYNGITYTNFEVTETGILVIPGTTVQFVLPAGDYCYEQQLPPNGKTEHEPLPPGKVTVPPTTSPGTPITNIDLFDVELSFASCEGPLLSGTYTLTNKTTNITYEVTVGADGKATTAYVPNGTYKVTGNGMVERELVVSGDKTETIQTQDCGTLTISFDRCDKLGTTAIYVFEKGATTPTYTLPFTPEANESVVDVSKYLPVGEYIIIPATNDTVPTDLSNGKSIEVKEGTTANVSLTEPCGTEEIIINFKVCDRSPITTIDVYQIVYGTETLVKTVDVKDGSAQIDLAEGFYMAYPGGTKVNGEPIIVSEANTEVTFVTGPCPDLQVEIEFKACDRITSGEFSIYAADASNQPTGQAVETFTLDNKKSTTVLLPNGEYVIVNAQNEVVENISINDQTTDLTVVELTATPCPDLQVEIEFKACDRITSGEFSIYMADGNGQLAGQVVETFTLDNQKSTTVLLPNGEYVIVNVENEVVGNISINDQTTTLSTVEITATPCPDLEVELKFTSCDRIESGMITIYNEAGEEVAKETVKNGETIIVELPNGKYVAKDENGNEIKSFEVDDKTTETQLVALTVIPCPGLEVELKFTSCDRIESGVITIYSEAGEEVVTKTVKNGETIIVELPNGKYVAKDENGNELKSFEIDDQTTDKPVVTLTVVDCPTIQVIVPIQACDYKTTTTLQLFEVVTVNNEVTYKEVTTATVTNNVATFAESNLTPGKTYVVVAQGDNPSVSTSTFTYTGNELTDIQLPVYVVDCPPVCAKTIEFDASLVPGTTVTIDEKTYVVSESGTVIIPMHTIEAGTYEVKEGNKVIGTIVVNEGCSVTYTPIPPKTSPEVEVEFKEQNSCLLYDERTFAIYYYTKDVGGEGVDWYSIHTFETSANENFVFELRHGQYYVVDITDGELPKEVTEATLKAATTPISFTVELSDTEKEVLLPDAECRSSFTFKFMRAFVGIVIVEKPDGTTETIEVKEGEEPTYTPTEPGDYTFCPQVPEGEEPLSCVTNTVPNTTGDKTTTKVTIDELDYRDPVDPEIPVKPEGNEQTPTEPTPNPGTDGNEGQTPTNPGTDGNEGQTPTNPGTVDNGGEKPTNPETGDDDEKPSTSNPGTDGNEGQTPTNPGTVDNGGEKPTNPETEGDDEEPSTPNPGTGGNGGQTPTPTPNQEVGGNNSGGKPTKPSTPTIKVPNFIELVNSINNDPTKAKEVLEELKTFIAQYNKLSAEEKRQLGPVDVESILAQIKLLENKLTAQEKLPQTNGDTSNTATLIGLLLLLLSACLLARKRFAK